ncbi:MAG: hypothetical protein M3346_05505, partial [Actinomycetota bacterium]|nr:hypothetical protein [Actinomycetota bacterium]
RFNWFGSRASVDELRDVLERSLDLHFSSHLHPLSGALYIAKKSSGERFEIETNYVREEPGGEAHERYEGFQSLLFVKTFRGDEFQKQLEEVSDLVLLNSFS